MFLAPPASFYILCRHATSNKNGYIADTIDAVMSAFYSEVFDATTTKRFKSGESCINKSLCVGNQAHHSRGWRKNPLTVQYGT